MSIPNYPTTAPTKQNFIQSHKFHILGAGLALIAGIVIGTAVTPEPEVVVQEKIVEVEVEGPTVEKQVVREVPGPKVVEVPEECLAALDYADEAFGLFSDAITEIGANNYNALELTNGELAELAPDYNLNKSACRVIGN